MPKPALQRRQVALIYDATRAYDVKVMTGVATYLREGGSTWSVYLEETALKDQRLPDLRSWHGDGVIANFDDPRVVDAVVASHLPAVAFGSGYGWYDPSFRIPYFFTNNKAIAQLAAGHLLEHGLRNFAYYGGPQTRISGWSVERERAFAVHVSQNGRTCPVYREPLHAKRNPTLREGALGRWLISLPKPVGLMAENDQRARLALEVCRATGLRVPDQVAVVGVDNDDLICHLSTPLLSSVEQGSRRVGYEAAALLDRIMRGFRPRRMSFVVDPVGVIPRASTDTLAIEEPRVAEAMRYIAEHAREGIQATEVASAVGVSRPALDVRFKRMLGKSIRRAIRCAQMNRILEMIRNTSASLKEIASATGFKSVQHMTTVFRVELGTPPAEYRKKLKQSQTL
ncbi:MAG TPA: DNA-binding transcriptional regulator [Terriglobales bacterium]|nr:DNA-binding transcriptional regulator [Terriglobales bacterium]